MNKKSTIKLFFFVLIVVLLTLITKTNQTAFNEIITFISIAIGFSITSLSIIATTKFANNLYKKESKKDNSKTLLHELVDKFRNSIYLFTLTICVILIAKLVTVEEYKIAIINIDLVEILTNICWSITIIAIYEFIELFNLFSKYVIKSAKE